MKIVVLMEMVAADLERVRVRVRVVKSIPYGLNTETIAVRSVSVPATPQLDDRSVASRRDAWMKFPFSAFKRPEVFEMRYGRGASRPSVNHLEHTG